MTWLDESVLAILGLSMLLGFWRGGIKSLLSLLSWFVAWWAAHQFADVLAGMLPYALTSPVLRHIVAMVLIFVATLLVLSLLAALLTASINAAGLAATNRIFGFVFGLLRGVLFLVVLTGLARWTAFPETIWWKASLSPPYLNHVLDVAEPWLPRGWVRHSSV